MAVAVLEASHGSVASPNVISFNACLHACDEAERLDRALELLRSMEARRRPSPDVISYSAVLNACAKLSEWAVALEELRTMHLHQVLPDIIAVNAAMSACAEAIQWEVCCCMLSTRSGADLDTVSYNAFLKACEKSEKWALALETFTKMIHHQVGCSVATFNTMLSCCQRGSQWFGRILGICF